MLKIFKIVLIIIGVDSRIVQRLTPTITGIAGILDGIARRALPSIWSKKPGKNTSPTPTNTTHNTPKTLSPHNHHPLPETIHTFATEFETKPHFRKYIHTNTSKIFNIISLIIQKILTPTFATIIGIFTILIICCLRILDFSLPLPTTII